MKKIILLLFVIFQINAQETIYEGDFKSDFKLAGGLNPLPFYVKENKILLISMKGLTSSKFNILDIEGDYKALDYNVDSYMFHSESGKSKLFKLSRLHKRVLDENDKVYEINRNVSAEIFSKYFKCNNLNDKYVFGLLSDKKTEEIDLLKNDIFLKLYDFKLKKSISKKLEKPNLERLKTNRNKAGFSIVKITNEYFIFVTKSISEDYKKCTIFLTRYNFEGKIISEKEILIDAEANFLLSSNNGAGEYDYVQTSPAGKNIYNFDDEMFINDIFYDVFTDDFYIYGLFGSKASKFNSKIETKGFYIYKFDSNQEFVWKKFNTLEKKKQINEPFFPTLINTSLNFSGKDLYFSASADRLKHYLNISIFEKDKGNIKFQNEFDYDDKFKMKYFQATFLTGGLKLDNFEDKLFSINTIANMYNDKRVFDYIQTVKSKKDVIFASIDLRDYSVLVESDNKNYFKFTKFNK